MQKPTSTAKPSSIFLSLIIGLFFLIYRFALMPLALTMAFLLVPFNRKLRTTFKYRLSQKLPTNLKPKSVWVHASSGEFEYAKPVIREIKKKHPNTTIVVTYSSPSYAKQIQDFEGVDVSLPLPLDLPGPTRSFLKKLNPCALLVARTDLWPELLFTTRKFQIPSLLFSTTFRPLNNLRFLLKPYYQFLFNQFTDIFAVGEADRNNILSSSTTTPTTITGDTRYDQVTYRLNHPKPIRNEWFKNISLPIVIAGSTWAEDESQIIPALKLFIINKKIKLILAPHEPTTNHLLNIEKQLRSHGLTFKKYTETHDGCNADVLLIDTVGVLAELYLKSDIAFVGGSFRSKVHSVMEPLAAGLPTLVGPRHTNNREAVEFQKILINTTPRQTAVTCVSNSTEMRSALENILTCLNPMLRANIRSAVEQKTGQSIFIYNWVKKYLPPEALT